MFSLSNDKTDDVYISIQAYFNIEGNWYLKKYLEIELNHGPDG